MLFYHKFQRVTITIHDLGYEQGEPFIEAYQMLSELIILYSLKCRLAASAPNINITAPLY